MKLYCNGDWVFWKKDEEGHYQVIKKINVTGGDAHWFREEEINMIMQDDGNLVVYQDVGPHDAPWWEMHQKALWASHTFFGDAGGRLIW